MNAPRRSRRRPGAVAPRHAAVRRPDEAALARRRAERGTGLRQEVNELLRAGLAAEGDPRAGSDKTYELPTHDPGRALIADHRALKDMLDEEDVERALRRGS